MELIENKQGFSDIETQEELENAYEHVEEGLWPDFSKMFSGFSSGAGKKDKQRDRDAARRRKQAARKLSAENEH